MIANHAICFNLTLPKKGMYIQWFGLWVVAAIIIAKTPAEEPIKGLFVSKVGYSGNAVGLPDEINRILEQLFSASGDDSVFSD